MTEWKIVEKGEAERPSLVEPVRTYLMHPGDVRFYDVGAVHAIDYPEGSRFVRVTGRDLDHVKRLKYDMAAGKAVTIESASASR